MYVGSICVHVGVSLSNAVDVASVCCFSFLTLVATPVYRSASCELFLSSTHQKCSGVVWHTQTCRSNTTDYKRFGSVRMYCVYICISTLVSEL